MYFILYPNFIFSHLIALMPITGHPTHLLLRQSLFAMSHPHLRQLVLQLLKAEGVGSGAEYL